MAAYEADHNYFKSCNNIDDTQKKKKRKEKKGKGLVVPVDLLIGQQLQSSIRPSPPAHSTAYEHDIHNFPPPSTAPLFHTTSQF
uniref:Uncharacterized protein n=1 Tax=Cucumis melo TaxID=3656 RepID=A0A9I9ECT2_CUCME